VRPTSSVNPATPSTGATASAGSACATGGWSRWELAVCGALPATHALMTPNAARTRACSGPLRAWEPVDVRPSRAGASVATRRSGCALAERSTTARASARRNLAHARRWAATSPVNALQGSCAEMQTRGSAAPVSALRRVKPLPRQRATTTRRRSSKTRCARYWEGDLELDLVRESQPGLVVSEVKWATLSAGERKGVLQGLEKRFARCALARDHALHLRGARRERPRRAQGLVTLSCPSAEGSQGDGGASDRLRAERRASLSTSREDDHVCPR
jgi:hypothetical protein